ncbi:MAG: hypothetical protein LPK19_11305, partial [Hymenobacteraceae bacterium]|nr:hypothetical protein [Hymenobacteraceae bacterium]MDX5396815.1 hypothetical protein [Hymenobacteraceae bacterium]MDX5512883.1 hypothetical protein [Hymenobacteraceae bacterium]
MIYRLAIWGLMFMLSLPAVAQLSSKRCKWVTITDEAITLDTLTIQPSSIQVFDAKGRMLRYTYNINTNQLIFEKTTKKSVLTDHPVVVDSSIADTVQVNISDIEPYRPDSVRVCYRVLPLNLSQLQYKRDIRKLEMSAFEQNYLYEDFSEREQLFSTPGLNKTGNISRGVSFGNTQNVFVNSSLNLQLEGKLSDEIGITAAITDQNIPFQPEGNTQQLQEFDRVYITLDHRLWSLTGGDVILRNKPGHFLKFYKNVQGGALEVKLGDDLKRNSITSVAGAVSKGKFASMPVTPIESVQGPYRLQGPNGERFIIIIANSERVYLDGKLLTRGFDYDYVIDYNQAEITFTPKHVIT